MAALTENKGVKMVEDQLKFLVDSKLIEISLNDGGECFQQSFIFVLLTVDLSKAIEFGFEALLVCLDLLVNWGIRLLNFLCSPTQSNLSKNIIAAEIVYHFFGLLLKVARFLYLFELPNDLCEHLQRADIAT